MWCLGLETSKKGGENMKVKKLEFPKLPKALERELDQERLDYEEQKLRDEEWQFQTTEMAVKGLIRGIRLA